MCKESPHCVRRTRSIPCVAGMGLGCRTAYWAELDQKGLWGARLGEAEHLARPKSLWVVLWKTRLKMLL
jgi:hypothetical protein